MTSHSVFVLQHSYVLDGCDETKCIGVYSTKEEAEKAILRLVLQPGFKDRPDDFHIDEYSLDKDHWTEGFATMANLYVKDIAGKWISVTAKDIGDGTFQIIEYYNNHTLGELKHLDIVKYEEREDGYYAVELVKRSNDNH